MSDASPQGAQSEFEPLRAAHQTRIALVGNPNTGKTTLFNRLTGLRAKTANYPGITVDLRRGAMSLDHRRVEVIDLPGTYSLDSISPEEKVAELILTGHHPVEPVPDIVVLVIDATNLERNLFLVSELLDLRLQMVVVLNLIDAAEALDIKIQVAQLSEQLGCPVVPVSSRHGTGIDVLKDRLNELVTGRLPILMTDHSSCTAGCSGCTFSARYDWAAKVSEATVTVPANLDDRTATIDRLVTNPVIGSVTFVAIMLGVFYLIFSLASVPMDLIDGVFATVGGFVDQLIPASNVSVLLWYPLAGMVSILIFFGSYQAAGIQWTKTSVAVSVVVSVLVACMPIDDFRSLVVDGVVAGVGGIVIFLPQICILFFFISVLEDSGYMARAAFVMERLMQRVGLPGKAFVPMLSAHACAIPGIMAARAIENWRDRLVTILVLPLLTCSARLPVYAMITALLFSDSPVMAAVVFVSAYTLGIVAALLSAWCLKKTILKGESVPLVIELPPYRVPGIRNTLTTVMERAALFVRQAGTVILLISVVLWALATYPKMPDEAPLSFEAAERIAALRAAGDGETLAVEIDRVMAQESLAWSFAGRAGKLMEPVFAPLGFDWKINIGVISSFAAREVVVSTLAIVYGIGEDMAEDEASLVEILRRQTRADGGLVFSTATGLSLLVFFVLAMQCLPTQAVTRRETGSWKWAAFQLIYMTVLAWVAAFATYQIGCASGLG
ncbi:MAG: ferrous iron transporter B [Fuerstiella sp.]|nr:ferrous iron transporter B [Fuerstiella sp.]